MNKLGKYISFEKLLLMVLVIICSIFNLKKIYIEPNNILEVSLSLFIYPITYLLIILIRNNSDFKNTHKFIVYVCILFLIYNFILSILNSIPGDYDSIELDLALKQALSPNYISIFNKSIYFSNILSTITFCLLFYFSHILIIILYEAMIPYTKDFIAFILSMFIPFTLDTICITVINDTFQGVEFKNLIINLTSNFVIIIISTILMTLIYSIIKKVRLKSKLKV